MTSSASYTLPASSTVSTVETSELTQVESHADEAVNTLIHFFRDKPRWSAVCRALTSPIQDQETVAWYYLTVARDVENAGGVHLDRLGAVVREPRSNRTDGEYRRVIAARILTNKSKGRIPDLYAIADAMTGDQPCRIHEYYPASMIAFFESGIGTAATLDVTRMLRQGKPAGVRLDTVIVPTGGGLWGSSTGTPAGSTWGSSTGTPVGALWSGVA